MAYDPSYAISVCEAYPDRFSLITPFDPADPAVEEQLEDWALVPGRVGARVMWPPEQGGADPGLNLIARTAAQLGLPVNLAFAGKGLDATQELARANPDTSIVIDHFGQVTSLLPPIPDDPFEYLPKALELASLPNVSIKLSGACTLSKLGYPFDDLWNPIMQIVDAYGIDRCMWGSDWTRTLAFATYPQVVDAFLNCGRFSPSDLEALMGGSLRRIYNWTPACGT